MTTPAQRRARRASMAGQRENFDGRPPMYTPLHQPEPSSWERLLKLRRQIDKLRRKTR